MFKEMLKLFTYTKFQTKNELLSQFSETGPYKTLQIPHSERKGPLYENSGTTVVGLGEEMDQRFMLSIGFLS
jgi:hypothetical protein